MNKIIAILFALSCFAASAISSSILGIGIWFWIIITAGVFVGASQFVPVLRNPGGRIASRLGIIAVLAVGLTLLAATTGGSFELGGSEALLVFAFFMIAVFGFSLARLNKN